MIDETEIHFLLLILISKGHRFSFEKERDEMRRLKLEGLFFQNP